MNSGKEPMKTNDTINELCSTENACMQARHHHYHANLMNSGKLTVVQFLLRKSRGTEQSSPWPLMCMFFVLGSFVKRLTVVKCGRIG
jgi:hypothetical protein